MHRQRKSKQKQIAYQGRIYTAITKNGDAIVRTQQSARGQNVIIGILDLATGNWYNINRKVPLPAPVKAKFELALL